MNILDESDADLTLDLKHLYRNYRENIHHHFVVALICIAFEFI